MSTTGLDDVMDLIGTPDRHRAYQALRGTLHALRDCLTVEEAVQLAAQLPMLVRGFYYEAWDPTGKPLKVRDIQLFFVRIESEFPDDDRPDPEHVARSVFTVLAEHVSAGEIEDVKQLLPRPLKELWPSEAQTAAAAVRRHGR
jgi:uncharacterized protein (DUF2267 family)